MWMLFCTLNELMYVNHRTAEVENECFMAICPESDLWKCFLFFLSPVSGLFTALHDEVCVLSVEQH